MGIQNPKSVILPTVHLKGKTEQHQVHMTLMKLSNDVLQVVKHALSGYSILYPDHQEIQTPKIHQLVAEQKEDTLPHTPMSTKCVCCLAEVNTQRKMSLDHTL